MKSGILVMFILTFINFAKGQQKDLKLNLNVSGTEYVKFTFLTQVWARYTQTNPGSLVYGNPVENMFDLGLRRTRMTFSGKVSPKVFFYTQFGLNNFNYLSKRYEGAFFHDILTEYELAKRKLSLGAGLTGWSGFARYASPSIGSLLCLDAPLYQQSTNGVSDQFVRKLSIYAKGKLASLDYRVAISQPLMVQNASSAPKPISANADFSPNVGMPQLQSYLMWQFFDEESNTTPYNVGSYLGKKSVFNIGVGIIHQQDATWNLTSRDTSYNNLDLFGVDLFYDSKVGANKNTVLTVYAALQRTNFGHNYLRNIGVMNMANGVNAKGTVNGAGNAFSMIGTGTTFYTQIGLIPKVNLFKNGSLLQLYSAVQLSNFEALNNKMLMLEGGMNYFLNGSHSQKLSCNLQIRPVFVKNENGESNFLENKLMMQIQYQLSI